MFITFKVDNNRNDYTNTYNYITSKQPKSTKKIKASNGFIFIMK